MSFFLKALRREEPGSPVAYHLEGLLEATERIRQDLARLDAAVDLDAEELAGRMVDLQVEIFDHMGYHMKELRRPLSRLISKAYRDLERLEREENQRMTSPKAKSASRARKARPAESRPKRSR